VKLLERSLDRFTERLHLCNDEVTDDATIFFLRLSHAAASTSRSPAICGNNAMHYAVRLSGVPTEAEGSEIPR